jgi:hypothetical protein
MANPVPEPPKSISAAELRRRLLASTPPPMGVGLASPEIDLVQELPVPAAAKAPAPAVTPGWAAGIGPDILARLRMPGQAAPNSVPQPNADAADANPNPSRFPVNRRTPMGTGYGGYAGPLTLPGVRAPLPASSDPARLYAENQELRQLLGEMKHLLQEASNAEQQYAVKQQEYEAALVEKNRQVEELSAQIHQIEEQISNGTLAPVQPQKTRTELEEWSDELEKENQKLEKDRKRLEKERKQLREDEEASEKQMRSMEVTMAKERAMMARQETELRRLHAEIQHELEIMNRGDSTLRDHMVKFQRRAQDAMGRPGGTPPTHATNNGSGPQGWGRR